jgi:hypothetical protein
VVKGLAEDPRLTRLTEVALALPEATRKICGSHAQFLVRKKTFAYFLDNHHGDGIVAVTCKVLSGDNKALADSHAWQILSPRVPRIEGLGSPPAGRGQSRLGRSEGTVVVQLRTDSLQATSRAALSIPAARLLSLHCLGEADRAGHFASARIVQELVQAWSE